MSENIALYRKYRPSSFSEVRDQDHIVRVLEGAIKKDTIPHAILFSGTRGTGKTTLARLFAQAIGTSAIDTYEIDAASNRGIDDIRTLREAVMTLPYESERKVYIIDEVHMLTKEAFNALLKTLEEPPVHVVFILATTEQDKLLDTILSRCQVFTMRSPSRSVLAQTVIDVAKREKYSMPQDAADLIAIAADGSFRDALGLTQKVMLASEDSSITADEVAVLVGAPQTHILGTLLTALASKDTNAALECVRLVGSSHVDPTLFMRLLLERLRVVILLRNASAIGEDALIAMHTDDQAQLRSVAALTPSALNSHTLQKLLTAAAHVGTTALPLLPLELAILDICST
jgi:DNA polymerase III subunit gamma/tau